MCLKLRAIGTRWKNPSSHFFLTFLICYFFQTLATFLPISSTFSWFFAFFLSRGPLCSLAINSHNLACKSNFFLQVKNIMYLLGVLPGEYMTFLIYRHNIAMVTDKANMSYGWFMATKQLCTRIVSNITCSSRWFNLYVIHNNRYKSNSLYLKFIHSNLFLVLWLAL